MNVVWSYFLYIILNLRFFGKALKTLGNQNCNELKMPRVQAVYSFLLAYILAILFLPFLCIQIRIISLRNYIKHYKECFIRYPNNWKSVKKISAAPRF